MDPRDVAARRQESIDAALSDSFRARAGGDEGQHARASEPFGYRAGSLLVRRADAPASSASARGSGGSGPPPHKPPNAPSSSFGATPEALRAYAQRIKRPGQVQDFGAVLLVASEASFAVVGATPGVVLAASENSLEMIGVAWETLLDVDAFDPNESPFDAPSAATLRDVLGSGGDLAAQAPVILTLRANAKSVYAVAHATEEGHVLDLEPIAAGSDLMLRGSLQAQSLVKKSVMRLDDAANDAGVGVVSSGASSSDGSSGTPGSGTRSDELTDVFVGELRELLGYDRCMMYRFHDDGHGEVVAESFGEDVPDRFKGLHFPSTDIPSANRAIFMSMRSRMIVDVRGKASKVRQSPRMREDALLGNSQLRGVSGCHGQYLANMGVRATFVVSIVIGAPERLWGLVVCHHYRDARRVPYYQRSAAEFLTRIFSLRLGRVLDLERKSREMALHKHQATVVSCLRHVEDAECAPEQLPAVMGSVVCTEPASDALMLAMNATGVAFVVGDVVHLIGQCPSSRAVATLIEWVAESDATLVEEVEADEAEEDDDDEAEEDGAASGIEPGTEPGIPGLDDGKKKKKKKKTPGPAFVASSATRRLVPGGAWFSNSLLRDGVPGAEEMKRTASGAVVVDVAPTMTSRYDGGAGVRGASSQHLEALAREERSSGLSSFVSRAYVVWFRGEFLKESTWAGDRSQPQAKHAGVEMTPRESFAAAREILRCESEPWQPHERRGAAAMQSVFRDVIRATLRGTERVLSSIERKDEMVVALNERADQLRTIIATADLPIVKVDADMRVVDVNNAAANLLGGKDLRPSSVVGESLGAYLLPESFDALLRARADAENVLGGAASLRDGERPTLLKLKHPPGLASDRSPTGDAAIVPEGAFRAVLAFARLRHDATGGVVGMTLTGRSVEAQRSVMRALDDEGRRASERRRLETPEGTATAPPKERSASDSNDDSNDDSSVSAVITKAIVPAASVDANGRVRSWNALMEFATGIRSHAAVGKLLCGELFGDERRGGELQAVATSDAADPTAELAARLVAVVHSGPEAASDAGFSEASDTAFAEAAERHVQLTFFKKTRGGGGPSSGAERTKMDVLAFLQPRRDGRAGAFLALSDMRAPRMLERAIAVQSAVETAAEAKSRHIAFVSHEIRNPVNGILASVEAIDDLLPMLKKGGAGAGPGGEGGGEDSSVAEMEDLVRTTLACGDQLRRTVDDMLDMSRLEAGKLELRETSFDAERLVRGVTSQIKSATERKGLALETRVSPLLRGVQLRGDSGRIEQVLINFCWNAVKFTNEGSVAIDVTCELREGAEGARAGLPRSPSVDHVVAAREGERTGDGGGLRATVFFKVIDTGEGMSKATMERVFERYAMGEHKSSKYGGSGLGLAICRSLADLMRGNIHCMSHPGEGSTFVLEIALPATRTEAPAEPEPEPEPEAEVVSEADVEIEAPPRSFPSKTNSERSEVSLDAVVPNVSNAVPGSVREEGPPDLDRLRGESPPDGRRTSSPPKKNKPRSIRDIGRQFSRESFIVDRATGRSVPVPYRPRVSESNAPAETNPAGATSSSPGTPPFFLNRSGAPLAPLATPETGSPFSPSRRVTVVRELVQDASAAVLVEVSVGEEVRQHWGGAPVGAEGVGAALASAQKRALAEALALFQPGSGVPSGVYRLEAASALASPQVVSSGGAIAEGSPRRDLGVPLAPPLARDVGATASGSPLANSRRHSSGARSPGDRFGLGGSGEASAGAIVPGFPVAARRATFDAADARSAAAAAADRLPEDFASPPPPPPPPADSVFIVDDDLVNVKVLQRAFAKAQPRPFGVVVTGEDGRDVVEALVTRDAAYDVVLLDENMRHMNGSTATAELRKHEARKGATRRQLVIVTTGNASESDKLKYQRAGFDAIMVKPMNLKLVVRWVRGYHAFLRATDAGATFGRRALPDGCPAPERRPTSTFEDGYFFGEIEVFGRVPRAKDGTNEQ